MPQRGQFIGRTRARTRPRPACSARGFVAASRGGSVDSESDVPRAPGSSARRRTTKEARLLASRIQAGSMSSHRDRRSPRWRRARPQPHRGSAPCRTRTAAGGHQPPARVAPDLEERQRQRACHALGHRAGVHPVAVVDAGDHDVQLLEDGVRVVERAVSQDVGLRPAQDPDAVASCAVRSRPTGARGDRA